MREASVGEATPVNTSSPAPIAGQTHWPEPSSQVLASDLNASDAKDRMALSASTAPCDQIVELAGPSHIAAGRGTAEES